MQVFIRFLAIGNQLKKEFSSFSVPENATVGFLYGAVESAGHAGVFCPATDWPGLPEQVLFASDAHMLRPDEQLHEGQQISIIGQMIGG
ncbi:MAG: hypothetical protein VB061_14905 [Christensenella sp.]|nr:hypothetical protein [Christensenella sp.]